MRRLLSIILAIFMTISNTCIVFANEEVNFYAYTSDTNGFDEYAIENLGSFIYGHYGYIDDTIELGQGITVYGKTTYSTVLYPIWKDDNIIATFKVVQINDSYVGTYSNGECEQLNYVMNSISINHPLKLIYANEDFYFQVNDNLYYSDNYIGVIINDIDQETKLELESITFENSFIVDAHINNEFNEIVIPRIPSSYSLSWPYSEHNPSSTHYCHAYSLSGILTNQGYSGYDFTTVKNGFVQYEGATVPLVKASIAKVKAYLASKGFTYSSSSSGSGYLTYESVLNTLYYNQRYVMAGLTHTNGGNHFGVIIGCTNDNVTKTFRIYDPQSGGNGICTMNADTRQYTNTNLDTYTFNAGYIYNIRK